MLADFDRARARGERGLVDPYKEYRQRPVTEHVREYVADLRAMGRDAKYVYNVEKRLNRLMKDCAWNVLADISADSFCAWREKPIKNSAAMNDARTIGPVTLNQHLEAARSFCRWCVKRKRVAGNPLAEVSKVDESLDVRRARRALTPEQLVELLAVVPAEHQLVYRFMLVTGLRRQEVEDLLWGDVRLNSHTPFLKLRAKATKSRRADTIPLRGDIATELSEFRGGAGDRDKVFSTLPTIEEHKNALENAGIPLRMRMAGAPTFTPYATPTARF